MGGVIQTVDLSMDSHTFMAENVLSQRCESYSGRFRILATHYICLLDINTRACPTHPLKAVDQVDVCAIRLPRRNDKYRATICYTACTFSGFLQVSPEAITKKGLLPVIEINLDLVDNEVRFQPQVKIIHSYGHCNSR